MKRLVSLFLIGSFWLAAPIGAEPHSEASASSPLGRWITASGNLEVEVAPCGEALCGDVVRVIANRSMSPAGGEMQPADTRDPMGMRILTDFLPSDFEERDGQRLPTEWRGQIYNRENAKTYRCIMTLGEQDELVLHAYVGLPWIGRSAAWTRYGVGVGGTR